MSQDGSKIGSMHTGFLLQPDQLLLDCIASYILSDRKYEQKPLYVPLRAIDQALIDWAVERGYMERCPHTQAERYWFVDGAQSEAPQAVSESALSKVWLTEEEDEAWKDL